MSEFIRAIGDDPAYEGRQCPMYIDTNMICKVYPVYAEKGSDGLYWRCTFNHLNAELITYTLVDVNGKEYSCGNEKELQKLGINTSKRESSIGFVSSRETGKQTTIDPLSEKEA